MAKGKVSRKRKVSATETLKALEVIADELASSELGGAPNKVADDDLFVFDTHADDAAIHIPHSGRKRQRASKEKKLTRSQAILAAGTKGVPLGVGGAYAARKRTPSSGERLPSTSMIEAAQKRQIAPVEDHDGVKVDAWAAAPPNESWVADPVVAVRPKTTGEMNRPHIAAVEIDPAGCSVNPDYEHHQDAIAEAVAAEMSKHIDKILEPAHASQARGDKRSSKAHVANDVKREVLGDDQFLSPCRTASLSCQRWWLAWDPTRRLTTSDSGEEKDNAARVQKKKTKKDRSRQERRRTQDLALSEKKSLKAQRRDIDSAKKLNQAITENEAELDLRKQRKQADLEEKERTLPPKLGRHRWQPARLQVLASDDVNGSLRTLRAFPMVAKDRFNSLQKRGVVQVTVQQHWTKPTKRRVKQYEKGEVRANAVKGQEEVDALARGNREREKKKKIKK